MQPTTASAQRTPVDIVIDGVFFQMARSGIARVWTHLLRCWVDTGFAQRIVVVDRAGSAPRVPGVRYHDAPAFAYEQAEADRDLLQAICDHHQARLFASTYYTYPVHTPSLMMVHDMIPEVLGWDLVNHPMWRQKHQALAYAAGFVAVSSNTAADLQRLVPMGDRTVQVTLNGCDFKQPDDEAVAGFRQRYGLSKPYFIVSGNRGAYKNAIAFFKAFEALGEARAGYTIVCTGGGQLEPDLAACIGPGQVRIGFLEDDDLQCAYRGAIALAYPSLYEGFGLPVLEAMACGCPVITMAASSLPEVGGDAVIYIRPEGDQVAQMVEALSLVQHPEVRQQLIAKGLQQAAGFTWPRMAEGVAHAMTQLIDDLARSDTTAQALGLGGGACRLCGGRVQPMFSKRLLGQFDVRYEHCDHCGCTQTERPYWLETAYVPENEVFDTGQVTRSLINAAVLQTVLKIGGLGADSRVVDYGCGSGLLVRTLRDMGVDAWGYDRYAQPRLALGFMVDGIAGFDVINLCEVVEHFDQPAHYFDDIFSHDPQVVMFQTGVSAEVKPDWDYLAPEHGQHIFFMSPTTIAWLARRHQRVALNIHGFWLLLSPAVGARLLNEQGAIRPEHVPAINGTLNDLMSGLFNRPYAHAMRDNVLLRERQAQQAGRQQP